MGDKGPGNARSVILASRGWFPARSSRTQGDSGKQEERLILQQDQWQRPRSRSRCPLMALGTRPHVPTKLLVCFSLGRLPRGPEPSSQHFCGARGPATPFPGLLDSSEPEGLPLILPCFSLCCFSPLSKPLFPCLPLSLLS